MAFWLVETAVVNSYILYKETVPNPKSHVTFRRSVVESLASRHIVCAPPRRLVSRPRKRAHSDSDVPERLNQRLHIVEQHTQRNCIIYRAAGRNSRSLYYCKTCPEKTAALHWLLLRAVPHCSTLLINIYIPTHMYSYSRLYSCISHSNS